MTHPADDKSNSLQTARESFSGKGMSETQLVTAVAIADILHAEIQNSGSFVEKLTDYSHAFARSERFDAMRAETMIRDIYTATRGQSMNQTREGLKAAERNLPENAQTRALACAESIGSLIQAPPTQPFYKAYDRAAVTLSREFAITQAAAKTMMSDAYKDMHARDLYEAGKEQEEQFHKPARAAEIAQRRSCQVQKHSPRQSRS